ncbi:hypothetical protein E6O75_ATG10370 [Venturia nashicola]|uniref:Uncharacterized protein n=1 Tax=Venturia nashicola TaxID=86259 RepID=A0A4Z1P8Q2_9PEZI|nr:hypothetical protein E6O75_ATG10370 [Venturia nashicola]
MATTTLSQQPISLNDTPVEPLSSNGALKPRDVEAVFYYIKKNATAEELAGDKSLGASPHTWGAVGTQIVHKTQDVADRGSDFTLTKHGFTYVKHASAFKEEDYADQEKILKEYRPETEALVKKVTGASKVKVFNHMTRTSKGQVPTPTDSYKQDHGQVYRVHVDQNTPTVEALVHQYYPEEAEELLKKRVQVVNVWRPISTVLRDPLGVADLHSQSPDDVAAIHVYMPDGTIATTINGCRENPNHKFYYKYKQQPDEPVLFLQFDNQMGQHCFGRCAHSAFKDPEFEALPARRSIECRTLVFYDEPVPTETEDTIPGGQDKAEEIYNDDFPLERQGPGTMQVKPSRHTGVQEAKKRSIYRKIAA